MPAEWAGARDAKNLPYQKAPHGLQPCQRSGLSRRALRTRPPGRLVRRNRATPRPGLPAAPAAGPACGRWWYRSGGRSGGELAEGHRCSAAGFATPFALRRSSFQEHLGRRVWCSWWVGVPANTMSSSAVSVGSRSKSTVRTAESRSGRYSRNCSRVPLRGVNPEARLP